MTSRFTSRGFICQIVVGSLSLAMLCSLSVSSLLAETRPLSSVGPTAGADGSEAARFVNDLLGKMTPEEKIGQMSQIALNEPQKVSPDQRTVGARVSTARK